MAVLKYLWLFALGALALATALWPKIDLLVTRQFYQGAEGFPAQRHWLTAMIHDWATGWQPMAIGIALIIGLVYSLARRLDCKPWLFLLLALVLGPGVVANTVFKDNWGRARPVTVEAFGGGKIFTPYWQAGSQCASNCSFVSGDGAFGFMMAAPGLAVARRRRLLFWGGTGIGVMFGTVRIMMGAHFLSDTVWAALLMLGVMFGLHALIYGRAATRMVWSRL